jgi:hypothetical protein
MAKKEKTFTITLLRDDENDERYWEGCKNITEHFDNGCEGFDGSSRLSCIAFTFEKEFDNSKERLSCRMHLGKNDTVIIEEES